MDRRTFLATTGAAIASLKTAQERSSRMLTRPIPSSGEALPVVGLGTWQTFDPPRTDEASLAPLAETLRTLHELGGRVVDSSPMYGKSEQVAGTLSARLGLNDDLWIATKVWTRGEREGVTQMEESMRLLQREKLELMQVHNLVDWRTHLRTLRRWKEEGRVKYVGVTHYVPSAFPELERIVRQERVDFVQLPYSVALRDAEARLLPTARDAGVAVLVNRPFEGGTLFRDVRQRPLPPEIGAWAESWAQAFLKFLLAHPAVGCVIPGTANPRHVRDNARAGYGRLPGEGERRELLRALAAP